MHERALRDRTLIAILALLVGVAVFHASARAGEVFRDGFEDLGPWRALTADGVSLTAAPDDGEQGRCARLDYDFARGSGYAIYRRDLPAGGALTVPANFRFRFRLRAEGPRNTLEFKVIQKTTGPDGAPAEDVWWVNQCDYNLPGPWRDVTLPKRKFTFAWGPGGGKTPLTRIDAIEIVVTSFNGGRGTVWLDELVLEDLPTPQTPTAPPRVEVSHSEGSPDGQPAPMLSINEDGYLGWRSGPITGAGARAVIDFGAPREFGGLALEWEPGLGARDYRLVSLDGASERMLGEITAGNGGWDYLVTPDATVQRLAIVCESAADARGIGLRTVRLLPPEFADSPNELYKRIAADAPRGWWPRSWLNEAINWTVVGADGDRNEALLSEDGAIEVARQGPSLEPFLVVRDRLLTWNEASTTQRLEDGYLPIPTIVRSYTRREGDWGLRLEVTCLADDSPPMTRGEGVLLVRYRLTNTGTQSQSPRLWIAARPVQVNPVYQFLNSAGGAADAGEVRADADGLDLNGLRVASPRPANQLRTGDSRSRGEVVEHLLAHDDPAPTPASANASERHGDTAALGYDLGPLEPSGSSEVFLYVPLHAGKAVPPLFDGPPSAPAAHDLFERRLAAVKREWTEKLNRVEVSLPPEAMRWWNSARSNLAYILINRDGPGLQPGSRAYERTWIRDGALESAALISLGHTEVAREFIDWFAPFQYEDGKVPCCVDRRGPDPVPEHDSHGEYLFAVANLWRHTGDNALVRRHWEHIAKAAAYIQSLRARRLTDEFCSPRAPAEKRVLCGLVPESISHEGYSAKPMHSYWDDLWCLKGLDDAAAMAAAIGERDAAERFKTAAHDLRVSLGESIRLAMSTRHIDYIPGCAELGDFDATSTTIGLWPAGEHADGGALAPADVRATFERFWHEFQARRDGAGRAEHWENYTPYEWRTVGSMIRLGWRERAHEAAEFYFADQRPPGWNQWAEVVWRDPRRAAFIGDMPHTWVGADFINSFVSMLAIEDDRDRSMVIGAGIPLAWVLSREGVTVRNLRTARGLLSLVIRKDGDTVRFSMDGLKSGEGPTFLSPPAPELIREARVDGAPLQPGPAGVIRLPRVPVTVEIRYGR